jgi:hypothetical protein
MIDKQITDRCKARLIAVARARDTITYSALADQLGVANQSVGRYLNAIYEEEMALGHPDLTVVVVYSKTGMGRFNSRGGPPKSIRVNPKNPSGVQAYEAELALGFMVIIGSRVCGSLPSSSPVLARLFRMLSRYTGAPLLSGAVAPPSEEIDRQAATDCDRNRPKRCRSWMLISAVEKKKR